VDGHARPPRRRAFPAVDDRGDSSGTTTRSGDRSVDLRSGASISAILIVTGASGSGKTTTVRALESRSLPGVRCYYFDAVGVPAVEAMEREFGSAESWQAVTTRVWLDRLAADPDSADVYVLDAQTPSFVRSAVEHVGTVLVRIVLLDCAAHARHARLAGELSTDILHFPARVLVIQAKELLTGKRLRSWTQFCGSTRATCGRRPTPPASPPDARGVGLYSASIRSGFLGVESTTGYSALSPQLSWPADPLVQPSRWTAQP
jgi:hypothetical protein